MAISQILDLPLYLSFGLYCVALLRCLCLSFQISFACLGIIGLGYGALALAVCSYLYAAQNSVNFILSKSVKHGIFMLGISIIIFLFNPGLGQGAFYLEHLNSITCANAGCALFLLCFSRVLLQNIEKFDFSESRLLTLFGITIGLLIVLFSAT